MTWSDPRPGPRPGARRRHLPAVLGTALAAAALAAWAGCGRGEPEGFVLRTAVERGGFAAAGLARQGLWFAHPPEVATLEIDHERRQVVLTSAQAWRWRGRIPRGAAVHAGVQLLPAAWRSVRRLQMQVSAREGRQREVLEVARTAALQDPRWLDLGADLARYAGREITLEFSVSLPGLPPRQRGRNLVAWGPVTVSAPAAERRGAYPPPPNIVFILIDTLRRDRLTPYGYRRNTSPEIARALAARGTVVDEAYSQAPWTLPSVVSLMTGRYPGEVLGSDVASFAIPRGVETLAEKLEKLGYATGGFLANPTLHVGAGFERGFQTFYAPPGDPEWMRRHADELNRHAIPWLLARQGRPFFLYAHYVDPHDPYENPEIVGNQSAFDAGLYSGPVAGDWVHGIYAGKLQLADPARDAAHIGALYDSEVHYADRYVGELLAALDPRVLARTLVVLTADHGEELDDHGGWKHGQTLYEEQIHVPLIFRWDGRIPAGRRLGGTVRLLDLRPTLLAAAGSGPDPSDEGIDLLPALTGRGPLPERPAFAEGLAAGPLRAAAVLGKTKLILFNRQEPFVPADGLQAYLWRLDLARLGRVELYDLARDPSERHNLAGAAPRAGPTAARTPAVRQLAAVIERRLDRALTGLWLMAEDLPSGSHLRGSLVLARAPRRWEPFFLAPEDVIEPSSAMSRSPRSPRSPRSLGPSGSPGLPGPPRGGPGTGPYRLRFDLLGDGTPKGLRIEGDVGRIEALAASLDGLPLAASRLRVGAGAPYGGGPLELAALLSRHWPGPAAAAPPGGLAIWIHDWTGEAVRPTGHDPETERRLRALGYLQ